MLNGIAKSGGKKMGKMGKNIKSHAILLLLLPISYKVCPKL